MAEEKHIKIERVTDLSSAEEVQRIIEENVKSIVFKDNSCLKGLSGKEILDANLDDICLDVGLIKGKILFKFLHPEISDIWFERPTALTIEQLDTIISTKEMRGIDLLNLKASCIIQLGRTHQQSVALFGKGITHQLSQETLDYMKQYGYNL